MTPSWWTDLWLNEGFASYVEYLGVEAAQPQLKLLEQFVSHDMQHVLTIDSLATSHPISIPVKHPDEINEIFDRISYAKGIFKKYILLLSIHLNINVKILLYNQTSS